MIFVFDQKPNIMTVVKLKFRRSRFTELTNSQWKIIKIFLNTERKRKHDLRTVINAILKLTRTGCQWRNMDEKYPPWESVYYYFRKWQKDGTWTQIIRHLVQAERTKQGRCIEPSVCAIDSQSIKIAPLIGDQTGVDAYKKINGRKRHIAVDILGLPLAFFVSAANLHDGTIGIELFPQLDAVCERLELLRVDGIYKGYFEECATICGYRVERTQKPNNGQNFTPQSGRWQVERSFGWFNFFRRLSKDFEKTVESSVAFMQIAFIDIILARLT